MSSLAAVAVLTAPPVADARPAAAGAAPPLDVAGHGQSSRPGQVTVARVPAEVAARWCLAAVLGVQAALSLRLDWSNTAFQDEALYLRAGQLEWTHWLHGGVLPDFPAYFSGAPVIYPPLAALADDAGGLVAARALSLCFMLAVTALLWATTTRLYGRRAALLATGLFATLAGTQFLGALATYDAMALFLLALACWLAVRSADCRPATRIVLLILAGLTLGGADATTYAAALFTPIVVVLATAAAWRRADGRAAAVAALTIAAAWLALCAGFVVVAGRQYWPGFTATTIDRPHASTPVAAIVQHAYSWSGLILVLGLAGAAAALRSHERARFLPAVLLAAALLAPAEQAWLGTAVSLQKHVVFGAWFGAIAAGYAMARLSRLDPGRGWAPVMAIPIAASTLFGSLGQADVLYQAWPSSTQLIAVLQSAIRSHPGQYLAEDYDVEAFYLRARVPWPRWSSTYYFHYPGSAAGPASFRAAISHHFFALIILDFGDTAVTDRQITADMTVAGGYHVLATTGPFTIWAAGAGAPVRSAGGHHATG